MEEISPKDIGQGIGEFCKEMHLRVEEEGDPLTGWIKGVRIIMFREKKFYDPQYDGPKSTTVPCNSE